MTTPLALALGVASLLAGMAPTPAAAQAPERKLAEMELLLLGVSATVEPVNPVIPKNTAAGVRIVVRSGGRELSLSEAEAFFGAGFWVEGELSGFSLAETKALSSKFTGEALSADPLLLPIPGLAASGDYELNNLRVMAGGHPVLEVVPQHVPVKVIEQVLVTSVKTRPLTLDEIRAKGIVLDSDDYYAFEFTLGLKLESKAVNITFPVAFDRQGVPIPQFILPPLAPTRQADLPPLPTIVPVLFEVDQGPEQPPGPGLRLPPLPGGVGEIRIPSVIIIPGNVGYLKQFFSAKLFVANGAPVGSGLDVRDITGKITLPLGDDLVRGLNPKTGVNDDPLAIPELLRDGQTITQPETMPVRAVGPDGEPGSADDVESLAPGEQGEAEFLVRGEREGFHTIDFDIRASLEGLVTGPVRIKGRAQGPVLVRNPYFDVSFTVPGVIRAGEAFKIFVTLTNLSDVAANSVSVTLPEGSVSGALFDKSSLPPVFPTIAAREAKVFALSFLAQRTGQVVASYLRFDPADGQTRPTGSLRLAVGIGERGIPLSPDTLVLPAAVDQLPAGVVEAAMRVLGQAWSVANAPAGTLPRDVVRTSRSVVTQKALALAEAGLRVSLGQKKIEALRDVAFDFWGGQPLDPGFDQLLRTTEAGRELRRAIGVALAEDQEFPGPLELESALAEVAASGPDFASFAVTGGDPASPLGITLLDGSGRRTSTLGSGAGDTASEVPGAALLPLGTAMNAPVLGVVAAATGAPYTLELQSAVETAADVSLTLPRGDGSFVRAEFTGVAFLPGTLVRIALDPLRPGAIVLEKEGESVTRAGAEVAPQGPQLVSATVIGPETLQGASPFGFQLVAVFDRVVDALSAAQTDNYAIPKNAAQGAKRQLSGRLVFVSLEQPEGPYIPTSFGVTGGVSDTRGTQGPSGTVDVGSRLEDPGAIVSGRVFQADGTPVGTGSVTYVNNSNLICVPAPNETGFAAQILDSEGHYEFRYVRQDNCGQPFKIVTVDPATGGRRQASAYVRAAGEAITLDLALFGRGAVEGTVRNVSGNAVPGASVVAYSQTDPQIGGAATTDGLGHYFIDGITVGAIVVKAGKGAALGSKPGRIERAGATTTVDLVLDGEAARVFGTVYKLEDGAQTAVPGVYVLFKHFSAESPFGQTLGATTTDVEGGYAFDGVPVGQFEVSAALNQRDRDAKQGVAVAGTPVSKDLLIVIPQPAELATVSGQVFMPDGATPAHDVVVTIGHRGVVSADGSFTIEGVAVSASAQTVTAQSRDGRRSGSTSVVANQPRLYDSLRIVLSGLGNAAFRVLDEKGQAVKGQQVALLGQCGNPCGCAQATTDEDGVAVFRNLSYGHFHAKAIRSTASFTDVANGSLAIVADDTTVLTTMRFVGAGRVEGTVRDPENAPVHGADVRLWARRFVYDGIFTCDLQYGYAGRSRTPVAGTYSFTGINLGPVSVSATQDFFGSGAIGNRGALSEPGQALTLDMKFSDTTAGVLSGKVFLPGGAPAGAGVEVAVEGPLPEVKVTTVAEGYYEFPHILPEGYYTLTARDPVGGGLARASVTLKRQEPLSRDIQLKGRGTVRVQVVSGPLDEPVESALVKITETEFPSRTFDQSVRPGNQGIVLFLDVYEGPLRIDVADAFARSGSATAVLPGPGEELSVQVKVTPTGRVTGRFLMPNGTTPVPYGTVTLKAGGRVVGQTTALGSGDVGRFSFDFVPVGPVSLDAQDPLTARVGFKSGILDHEGDPPLVLNVIAQGLGQVHGTVTRGSSSQALARVVISSGAYRATTLSDGSGQYAVDGVPEGRVTVTASLNDQGFLAGSNSAALEGDGESVQIDVALRDAGSVAGRIVPASEADRAAGRFPPSTVRLYVGGTGGGTQETSTRPDGSFSFDVVPTGLVSFTADVVDSIDAGSATLDVVAGANAVEIPLVGVGRLKGQGVASEDSGAPGVDGWISLSGPAFPFGATVRLGNDGLFEIPEVLAGAFTARLQHGQGALALYGSATGTVEPGQEREIRVALQPSGEIRGSVFRPAAVPEGKRPAFGAEVKIVLATGGEIPLLAQEEGDFSVKGVPHGDFLVRVFDPVSNGRAVVGNLHLTGDLTVVPEILIDDAAPVVSFAQPASGSTKSALGGLLVLEVTPETAGDVDLASTSVTYPNHGTQVGASFGWDPATRRLTGSLVDAWLGVGSNTLVASVKDLSGNVGQAQVSWTVTGGTVRGRVVGGDGHPKAGATVRLGNLQTTSQGLDGAYAFFGLRPGQYSAKAIDPDTGLESPSKSGTLVDGEELVLLDLELPAAGRLDGTVVHKGDAPADGVTVTWSNRADLTKNGGQFDLGLVPVGAYSLAASAPDGDMGAASASVTAGASANATIRLNGVGQVEVTVKNASLALAPNAAVSVSSSAPFPRLHTGKKTGPLGEPVTYDRVLSGTIAATASLTGLGGQTTGFLDDGGLLRLTVTLEAAGRISGVVTRREGGPASASVHLTGPKNVTVSTDPGTGAFAFENVPFGHFQLSASTPEGDFGSAEGDLTAADPDVTAPITLNGLGTVTVHVTDADGIEVPGAHVTVSSLGRSSSKDADGTGTAAFANVPAAASVHATATHPTNGAKGEKDGGPLAAAGTLGLEVALERLGTVSGTVFGPDGLTAVDGVEVRLSGPPVITHDGGQFAFTNLKFVTHTLTAYVGGRLRARASIVLDGPQATQNLTLVGVGTVKGTVTRSGGAVVVGAKVHLQSHAPIYGGSFDTETIAGGAYEIRGVPIGSFTISATLGADTRQKDGTLTHNDELVPVDLELLDSAIALPRDFWDGNALQWTLSPNGSLRRGLTFNHGEGTPRLTVVRDGASASFTGPGCPPNVKCAPTEENGREVVLRQADLVGLEATRKVFFPADGYFIRVVDLLYNPPTGAPATVSVLREAQVGGTTVVRTSSGDAMVGSDDDWVAIDDTLDDDIYHLGTNTNNVIAPTAFVLAGPGRAAPSSLDASQPAANRTLLAQTWDDVTIAPGQTVAFLSLFAAQADRARAVASAERLVQLPPEALAGLSAQEADEIVNFAVPLDLVSSVPPLPPNDGVVSGRALASDGETPSDTGSWTSVEFRSRSLYYGRPLTDVPQAGDPGVFIFRGAATPNAPFLVPRGDFDLTANASVGNPYHPFAVPPVTAAAGFPSEGLIDLTNVVGRVLRVSSSSGNYWQTPDMAVDDDLGTSWHTASGDAANRGQSPFFEIGLPGEAKVHEVRIRGTHAGDSYSIHAGRIDLADVSGAVLWSADVSLPLVAGRRDADIPVPAVPGVRSIRFTSTNDRSYNPGLAELRVLGVADLGPGREAKQDLVFRGTGRLEVRVTRSDGSAVPGSYVWLSDGFQTSNAYSTTVDSLGSFQWRILPPGTYTVFARHPTQNPVISVGDVNVSADALSRQDLAFEPFGSISGTVTTAKGGAIAAAVRLEAAGFQTRFTSSNATTGLYVFSDVPPGPYTLTVTDNRTQFPLSRPVDVAAGPSTPADFTLRPVTTIAVTATLGSPTGPPVPFAPVYVEEPGREFRFVGYVSNGSRNVTATGPTVTVRVQTTGPIPSVGEAQATFDEGDPVQLPIVVPGLGTITGKLRARDGKVLPTGTYLKVLVANPEDPTQEISTTVAADGSFELTSVPVRPLLLRSEDWEFNNFWTSSVAEVPVALSADGETLPQDALAPVGEIVYPGQVEAWEIRPSADASITLLLIRRAYANVTAMPDPLLDVYAPDGTLVAANDNRNASDKNSELSFTATGGPYVILARGAKGSTGGYRLASRVRNEDHVFRPWSGRLFSGVVTRLEDGAPAAGQGLRLLRRGEAPAEDVVLITLAADPQGAFSFPGLWSGSLALEAIDAQGIALARREFDVGPGQDPGALDLVVPVHGTVTVHVMRGSNPVSGVVVEVESARTDVLPGDKKRQASTEAGGSVSFSMPIGAVTARATDPARPGSSPVEVPGTVVEAVPADLTIDFAVIRVDVEGFVTNTSLTPLPGATVELVGFGTSPPTGADGFYRFTNVSGARTWTIRASHPKATTSQSVTLVLGDQNARQDFTLAVPVLKGRVVEPDDTGVAGARVQVCGGYSYDPCLAPSLTTEDGGFIFVGRPTWSSLARIVVTLRDGSNLQTSRVDVPFNYYTTGTVEQNVTLPVTASVAGTVSDHEGALVPQAQVSLYQDYSYYSYKIRDGVTDGNGQYRFLHMQIYGSQAVRVYAESPAGDPGENRGTLEPGQALPLDVSLLEGAELRIDLRDETFADLGGGVTVQALLAPAADGGTWNRSVGVVAGDAASGRVHVPLGPFRVVHDDPAYNPGAAEGELGSGESLPVPVRRSSHVRQPQTLGGPEGSYNTAEWCGDASCGPFAQTVVPGLREGYPPYVRPEAQGRALRSLQLAGVGLRVRRQQYVPPSGAFARTLTTLRNTSGQPMTLVLSSSLRVDYGSLSGSFGVGDPFGVVDDGGSLLALVVGSRLRAVRAEFRPPFSDGESDTPGALETDHVVPLDPDQTVAFITFSLASTDGDRNALLAKASALVDLSQPEALAGLNAQERAAIVNFDVPPLGDVEGSVRFGGTGVVGAQIGLVDAAGDLVSETTTGEDGAFLLQAVAPGSYSAAAFDPASGRRGRLAVDVVAGAVSQAQIELFDDAALGSVRVHAAWERVGGPVPDAELTLSAKGFGPVGEATVVTDANGEGLFTGIPAGAATVRWPDFYRAQPGTVTVLAGQTVNLELVAPPPGNVSGHVRAAGGSAPVPYARVEALDIATGVLLASGGTDDTGSYSLFDLRAGAAGFKVRAIWPADPTLQAERSGSFSQAYETIESFDLELPIAAVTGQVLFDGGTGPVAFPAVFATPTGVADPRTYYADQSRADGTFSVLVGGVGDYLVTGQDNDSGLTGQASVQVADLATGAQVPVQLQPSGSVTVTVSAPAGVLVSSAQVALSSRGLAFDRFGNLDGSGSFTFARVALGGFLVQAADSSATVRGSATGGLVGAGASTSVPIELPETSWLEGQIFGTQHGYADVLVRSLENDGPLGPAIVGTSASPYYGVWVPVGPIRVGAVDYYADPPGAGLAEGVVGPPSDPPTRIDVTLGNATALTANLAGSDGFRYDPGCDGTLSGGGSDSNSAYSGGAYYVGLAGRSFPGWPCLPASAEEGGRELVIGPRDVAGIRMTRQVYVPPTGGFARYLELLTNPGDAPVTVPVTVESNLASDASTRIVASPASTGRRYALTDSSECCRPVLGHVFAGPGGRLGVSSTRFEAGNGNVSYLWTVTIGPRETVALMHFAVQRDRLDTAGATQQAEALANLTDPRVLDGMTPLERSQVVNFDVP